MFSRLMPPTVPLATTFADLLGRPVRMEPVPRETWESLFHARFDWGFDLRRNRPRSRVNFNSETDFTEADFSGLNRPVSSVLAWPLWSAICRCPSRRLPCAKLQCDLIYTWARFAHHTVTS